MLKICIGVSKGESFDSAVTILLRIICSIALREREVGQLEMRSFIFSAQLAALLVSAVNGMYRLTEKENEELQRTCGSTKEAGRSRGSFKVFGGVAAKRDDIPWALAFLKDGSSSGHLVCSGTFISPYHFITAAHCITRSIRESQSINDLAIVAVMAGGPLANSSETKQELDQAMHLRVTNFVMPKSSEPSLGPNHLKRVYADVSDFLIGEIEANPQSFAGRIRPICVPSPDAKIPPELTVFGYGNSRKVQAGKGKLHSFLLPTKKAKCKFWPIDKHNRFGCSNIFAVKSERSLGRKSICSGDSGAGASGVEHGRHTIFGVTMGNQGDFCEEKDPEGRLVHMFTRVSYHHDFICYWTGVCPLGSKLSVCSPEEAISVGQSQRPQGGTANGKCNAATGMHN